MVARLVWSQERGGSSPPILTYVQWCRKRILLNTVRNCPQFWLPIQFAVDSVSASFPGHLIEYVGW